MGCSQRKPTPFCRKRPWGLCKLDSAMDLAGGSHSSDRAGGGFAMFGHAKLLHRHSAKATGSRAWHSMDASERYRLLDLADKQYAAWMEMINTIPDRRHVSLIDSVGSTRQPSVEEYDDPVPLPLSPKADEPAKRPTFRKSQTSKRSSASIQQSHQHQSVACAGTLSRSARCWTTLSRSLASWFY